MINKIEDMFMRRFILRDSVLACSAMLLVAGVATSCILPEKCIFIYKTGHRWTGNVAGTAVGTNVNVPSAITGKFTDCKSDADHAILASGDMNDPQYLALRNELLADAAVDCAQQAGPQEYKQDTVKCDPFSQQYTLTVTVEPDGACTLYSETVLVKGSKDQCIGPEESQGTSGTSSSSGEVAEDPTVPTTTAVTDAGENGGDAAQPAQADPGTFGDGDLLDPCEGLHCGGRPGLTQFLLSRASELLRRLARGPGALSDGAAQRTFSRVDVKGLPGASGLLFGDISAVDGVAFTHAVRFLALVREVMDADAVIVTTSKAGQIQHHVFVPDDSPE